MMEKFAVAMLILAMLIILVTLALFPMMVGERGPVVATVTAAAYVPGTATPTMPFSTWTPEEEATSAAASTRAVATLQAEGE